MVPTGADVVLVRYGEIGTKSSRVRGWMERRLLGNVEALFADRNIEGYVEQQSGRLFAHVDEAAVDAAAAAATDAPGVVSASPAVTVEPSLDAVADALADLARQSYAGGTFAVDASRAGHHPFDSEDVGRVGGQAVWEAVEDRFEPAVDLDDPDHTFYADVRPSAAYVFAEKRPGPGGLPLGSQDPLVALVSGGIDSPVAAYEVMRRGSPVVPLYLDLGEYGGPDHRARAEATARRLADLAPNFDLALRVAPAGDVVADLAATMDRGRMLALRRFTFRVAEHVAREADAAGIVTGEAIGQKSSQTAANLAVTSAATSLPVHRPLLTTDKSEITERAKALGTFEDATVPAGCNRVAPEFPETSASLAKLREVEPDDLFERAEAVANAVEVVGAD